MDLDSSGLYLRAFEIEDLETIYRWHNDPDLYSTLLGTYRPVNHSNVEEWLRKRMAYSTNEENYAVCLRSTSQHIGNIYLQEIDWINRNAQMGLFLGEPSERLKGYGKIAGRLVLKRAFEDLGLQRVYAYVFADNMPVIKGAERIGYRVEGALRKHVYKQGEFKDVLVIGALAEDYFSSEE